MEKFLIDWFLEDVYTKAQIFVTKSPFHVGRAENMDLVCRSVNVSRNHADLLVYIDGSLHVKENKSVNGTFINKVAIEKDKIIRVQEGDEIGFGAHSEMSLTNVISSYVYIVRRKPLPVIKTEIKNNGDRKPEMNKQENIFIDHKSSINVINNGIHLIPSFHTNENYCESSIVDTPKVPINKCTVTVDASDVANILNNHEKQETEYIIDGSGCIVIDCDIDDSNIIKKKSTPESNINSTFNDTIFCNIKKELEELDKYEGVRTYCVDSDSGDEFDQIFDPPSSAKQSLEDEKTKQSHNEIDRVNAQICTITSKFYDDINLKNTSNKIKRKTLNHPPVVAPHFEKNLEKRKRPSSYTNNESLKKIKIHSVYNSKLKENNKNVTSIVADDKICERKLDEVAMIEDGRHKTLKITCDTSNQSKLKINASSSLKKPLVTSTTKVKISESRGKSLETPVLSASKVKSKPSTARKKPFTSVETPATNRIFNSPTSTTRNFIKRFDNKTATSSLNNSSSETRKINSVNSSSTTFLNKNRYKTQNGYNNRKHISLMKDVEDIVLEMLTWQVSWFINRNCGDTVPQLRKDPLQRMNKSFTSYSEYYSIVIPLLLVEVWNFLYKEVDFNFNHEPIIYFTITRKTITKTASELNCLIKLPREKNFKEGDIVALQLYVNNEEQEGVPHKIAVLGYVAYVYRKNFIAQEASLGESSKNIIDVNASIVIQHINGELVTSGNYRPFFQYITSFVSSTRVIRSVKYLEQSPLCEHILRPSMDLYRLPPSLKPKLHLMNELNESQLEAVAESTNLCFDNKPNIYLIHGPPGTGKTTVIINIILSIILDKRIENKCILVTAPTNAAIDELAVRIISAKTQLQENNRKVASMVRIGPRNSIRPEVQSYSLYQIAKRTLLKDLLKHESIENRRKLQEMKDKIDFWKIREKQPEARNKIVNATLELEEFIKTILGRTYSERISECEKNILRDVRIICTTLSSCASLVMENVFSRLPDKISCCIIDEATQSTEQETLIPLILGVTKLILVGDPKQLPALSFAQESKMYGFGQSLFSRIDENFKDASYNPIRYLSVQYRMHPAICLFPNQEYYEGKLKNAPVLFNRNFPLNILQPYLVFHFQGDTENTEEYRNKSEILCVILLLEAIVSKIVDNCNFSVGIITPYNDQKEGIKQTIKKKTFRSNVSITVNTVDSFQGRENDIIIMSCVRCHANNFLSDDQRLNVALTRARYALYIIGSTNLFTSCPKFGKIRKNADRRKLLKNLDMRMPRSAINKLIFR